FNLVGALAVTVLFADDALWALPLLWIALLVSSYPLRRALFGERWSAFAFLRYAIFSAIGQSGVWLLAAFAPALVTSLAVGVAPNNTQAAVRVALGSGAAFAAVILVWQRQYVRVFLALHRAAPLRTVARPELMAVLPALFVSTWPSAATPVSWCIPALIAIMLAKQTSRRRDAETASDARAVALTGDAGALVSALTKLHVYSRVPRRWPHAVE